MHELPILTHTNSITSRQATGGGGVISSVSKPDKDFCLNLVNCVQGVDSDNLSTEELTDSVFWPTMGLHPQNPPLIGQHAPDLF